LTVQMTTVKPVFKDHSKNR